MGGAVLVGLVALYVDGNRTRSLLGAELKMTTARGIDRRLIVSSTLFGIGGGVAGFCPSPALVALGVGEMKAVVFVAAMLAGMGVFELLEWRGRSVAPQIC